MYIPPWWIALATRLWHFLTKPSPQQGQSQNVVNYGNNCTFNIIQAPPTPQKKARRDLPSRRTNENSPIQGELFNTTTAPAARRLKENPAARQRKGLPP